MNELLKEKLLSSVIKNESTGCWEWQKSLRAGYGTIKIDGKLYGTHRISYEVFIGPIPQDLNVCHTCDNRKCINPRHLFLGTQSENMQDCKIKNRLIVPEGVRFKNNHRPVNRVLTDKKILKIKNYMTTNYPKESLVSIAKKFKIKYQTLVDMRRSKPKCYYNK